MTIELLTRFRNVIYSSLKKRKDATMNLLDAISSFGHQSRSVVQLSEAKCFERKYSSITDAISDGLPATDWKSIEKNSYKILFNNQSQEIPCFVTDCTSSVRPFSKKLADKTITHHPNPAPGNKPICVGHQYSCVGLLPTHSMARDKKWLIPLSMCRVNSTQKGNEVGTQQILDHISDFELTDQLVMSVGDSLYGSVNCRAKVAKAENLIYVFRVNTKRNVFSMPIVDHVVQRGRNKEYGDKMSLFDPGTHRKPDQIAETNWLTRKGKIYRVIIEGWNDMLMRGTTTYRGSQHPMVLVRIRVFNENQEPVYKHPLWVAALGGRRGEVSLITIYQNYTSRYDMEHFFRFGKSKLLLDSFQTPDVKNEENWWRLCVIAYSQLYLVKSVTGSTLKPWEKYLPEHRDKTNSHTTVATPSQAQRGFNAILQRIGTPAAECVPRGLSSGKLHGQTSLRRQDQPIIFKTKKTAKPVQKLNFSGFEASGDISNPKIIGDFVHDVWHMLGKITNPNSQFTPIIFNTS